MGDFEVRFRTLDKAAHAALAEVTGAVDTATLDDFQAAIDDARKAGSTRIVVDFSKVQFVNSTGLGLLVKVSDSLKEAGGGLALIRVPAKVRLVIEMLGLDTYFTLRENEDEALFALGISPEGAGPTAPLPASPAAVGTCDTCGLLLSLPEPGSYRCPRCFTAAICSEDGEVSFWVPDQPAPIVIAFPCRGECLDGIIAYLQAYLKKLGYSAERVRDLEGALREIGKTMRDKINADREGDIIHLKIETEEMLVRLEFSDYGKTLSPQEADAAFRRTREVSDEFSCSPHPLGGNIIRLTKRK